MIVLRVFYVALQGTKELGEVRMVNHEQSVIGIVYEPDDAHSETHSHEIFLITVDGRPLHTHGFAGITSLDDGHRHRYSGLTLPAPSGVPHTHAYETITTFDDGHKHLIRGRTGPAIPVPGGGHIHFFRGTTTVNGRTPHYHTYSGQTGNEQMA